jgi:hypothetical protein
LECSRLKLKTHFQDALGEFKVFAGSNQTLHQVNIRQKACQKFLNKQTARGGINKIAETTKHSRFESPRTNAVFGHRGGFRNIKTKFQLKRIDDI